MGAGEVRDKQEHGKRYFFVKILNKSNICQ